MNRWVAKLLCGSCFHLGIISDRVFVRPIPNCIWWLQLPGAKAYQFFMGHSYLIDERYQLGGWEERSKL